VYLNEIVSDKTGLFEVMRAVVKTVTNLQVPQSPEEIINIKKELFSVEELVTP
jgi:hypothetical protein